MVDNNTNKVVPNFSVIGAARSGTTVFATLLSQHPDVFITQPKEPHFYAHAESVGSYQGDGDDLMMNNRIVSDPDEFYNLFSDAAQYKWRGDGSVSSLCFPEDTIGNIDKYGAEDFKIIVMLRAPVERCFSSYLYLRGRGHEPVADFAQALKLEDERVRKNYHHMWRYQTLSRYREQLEPFHKHFGDNMLVLVLEEFKADWEGEVKKAVNFLNLDSAHTFEKLGDVNRGGEPKNKSLIKLSNLVRSNVLLESTVKSIVPKKIREGIKRRNLQTPIMPDDIRQQLTESFAEDVSFVEALLNRSIPSWH